MMEEEQLFVKDSTLKKLILKASQLAPFMKGLRVSFHWDLLSLLSTHLARTLAPLLNPSCLPT